MSRPLDPHPPSLPPRGPSEEDAALLLDALRGELAPAPARRLGERLAHEPALAAEQRALADFLARTRTVEEEAAAPEIAARIVARVREQVAREARGVRKAGQAGGWTTRVSWVRLVGISVTLHAALLATFLLLRAGEQAEDAERSAARWTHLEGRMPAGLRDEDREQALASPRAVAPRLPIDPTLPLTDPLLPGTTWPEEERGLRPLADRVRDHPPGVALAVLPRTVPAIKRGRLEALGFDARGTLLAVARGLDALAGLQRPDGSWPAAGSASHGPRSAAGSTALALLPFLGDGHASRSGARSGVVATGVAFLRRDLFAKDGRPRDPGRLAAADLGLALVALSEDAMLSWGRLTPAEAERRAVELQGLVTHLGGRQRPDGGFPGAEQDLAAAVWPMWGLEAAARTGVALPAAEVTERFRDWYLARERPAGDLHGAAAGVLLARDLGGARAAVVRDEVRLLAAAAPPEEPFYVVAAGTGLLRHDPQVFRAWSAGLGQRLVRRLLPTGLAAGEDKVGGTALLLLALQVAYRTY